MIVFDFIEAALKLGIPMLALSWFVFRWLYSNGDIEREADQKSTKAQLKKLGKSIKGKDKSHAGYIYSHWVTFGGGFYGLAALWTFVVIEVQQFIGFIFNFPSIRELLEDGIISFVFEVAINQLANIVTAFVWFSYWQSDSMILWVLVAYLGYRLGMDFAKKGYEIPVDEWRGKFFDD